MIKLKRGDKMEKEELKYFGYWKNEFDTVVFVYEHNKNMLPKISLSKENNITVRTLTRTETDKVINYLKQNNFKLI